MKGDFSRIPFDPAKHYAGVLHQQGRVWLDSDWNEDVLDRLETVQAETRDLLRAPPAKGGQRMHAEEYDDADDQNEHAGSFSHGVARAAATGLGDPAPRFLAAAERLSTRRRRRPSIATTKTLFRLRGAVKRIDNSRAPG